MPLAFVSLSLVKYSSLTLEKSAPFRSTFALVAMQKRWFTRRRGTPFTAYGPVTRSSPLSSCFRKTTRRPRNRPARRMRTAPGVSPFFSFVVFWDFFTLLGLAIFFLPFLPKALWLLIAWPACPILRLLQCAPEACVQPLTPSLSPA